MIRKTDSAPKNSQVDEGIAMEAGAENLGEDAYNHFRSAGRNRAIQIIATNLMLSADGIQPRILAILKALNGFPPEKDQEHWGEFVDNLIAWAHEEQENDFQGVRRSALVSTCSALEYSAKCLFVARAELEPASLDAISTKRLSVSLGDYVSAAPRDRYFALADKLFQEVESKWHFDKFSNFVKTIAPELHTEYIASLLGIAKNDFNEAFAVRNCVVHHGSRVSTFMSRIDGIAAGGSIRITLESQKRYARAMNSVAEAIAAKTPPILI